MTLSVHRGANVRCGRTGGISIAGRSTGFACLGRRVTAASAFVLGRWTSRGQRIIARASTVTGSVTTGLSTVCTAIRTGITSRCNLL